MLCQELLQGMGKCVRGIGLESGRLDVIYFGDLFRCHFGRNPGYAGTHDCGFQRPASVSGDGLAGGNCFPGDAIQLSFALFNNHENIVNHRVRSLNRRRGKPRLYS